MTLQAKLSNNDLQSQGSSTAHSASTALDLWPHRCGSYCELRGQLVPRNGHQVRSSKCFGCGTDSYHGRSTRTWHRRSRSGTRCYLTLLRRGLPGDHKGMTSAGSNGDELVGSRINPLFLCQVPVEVQQKVGIAPQVVGTFNSAKGGALLLHAVSQGPQGGRT